MNDAELRAWQRQQIDVLIALGDDPVTAQEIVALIILHSSPGGDPREVQLSVVAPELSVISDADIQDARADWHVDATQEDLLLLDAIEAKEEDA